MQPLILTALVFALLVINALASNGVDISQAASLSAFQCLKNNG
jgi:hypothetical protein